MKKILFLLTLVVGVCTFVACSSNTPTGATERFIGAMKDGNFDAAVEVSHFKNMSDKEKEQMVAFMETKVGKSIEAKGGIDSYKVISEEMAEDGENAKVTYTIKYGNGTEDTETTKLVKVDGNWMIDTGK